MKCEVYTVSGFGQCYHHSHPTTGKKWDSHRFRCMQQGWILDPTVIQEALTSFSLEQGLNCSARPRLLPDSLNTTLLRHSHGLYIFSMAAPMIERPHPHYLPPPHTHPTTITTTAIINNIEAELSSCNIDYNHTITKLEKIML